MTSNDNHQARMIEYLTGVLTPSEATELGAALADDADLRRQLAAVEIDLEAVRRGLDHPPGGGLVRSLLEAAGGAYQAFAPRVSAFLDLDLPRTRMILDLAQAPPERWAKSRSAGTWTHPITAGPRHQDATAFLLRIEPGAEISRHRHLGDEWGFVLGGRLADDEGELKAAGDIVHKPTDSVHRVWNPGAQAAIAINIIRSGYDWDP